jgi:N-acetylneuraminic acid mutarotase
MLSAAVYAFTPESLGGPAVAEVASLASGRMWNGAVALHGKIYSIGGEAANDTLLNDVLEYDPAADTWSELATMHTPRLGVRGAVAHERIYMCGGFVDDPDLGLDTAGLVESYDPTDPGAGWTQEETMSVPKYWHAMESVHDSIYLFSGYRGHPTNLENKIKFSNVVEYSPVLLTTRSDLPGGSQYAGSSAVINDRVYIFGGYVDGLLSDRVLEYDPGSDAWATMDLLPQGALTGTTAVAVGQKALVMGGRSDTGVSVELWEFDPAAGPGSQWTRLADLPEERCGATAVFFDDSASGLFGPYGPELIFVVGGHDSTEFGWSTSLMYDVNTDTWLDPGFGLLPEPRSWAAAACVDNKIFAVGGLASDGDVLAECLVLDLENPLLAWSNAGQMPTARYGHGCVAVGSNMYFVGGLTSNAQGETLASNAVEVLDGTGGHWTHISGLSEARGHSFVAATQNGALFVIGGYSLEPSGDPEFLSGVVELRP